MPQAFVTARNPLLSLFQSAAHHFAKQQSASGAQAAGHPMAVSAGQVVAQRQNSLRAYSLPSGMPEFSRDCAELGLQLLEAIAAGNAEGQRLLRNRLSFSRCDPLWSETLLAYAERFGLGGKAKPIPYVRYQKLDDFVVPAPSNTLRIGLLSDWGTGTEEARRVAQLLARQQPDILIHLGDIYFSGTPGECSEHFLTPLRTVLPRSRLFTLCGNHDVYSGGEGYYGLLREIGQPASYFCLRSPDQSWQILAMDTGLNDRDPFDAATALTRLDPAEETWHVDKIRDFPGQTILLSHHQPFSAFAQIGPNAHHNPVNPHLMASYARFAQAGRIDAWFWGHEHRLHVYAPYRDVPAGRDIGYGAIPVAAAPEAENALPGLQDPPLLQKHIPLDVVEGAYTHGFALLDLAPGQIAASYWALTRPDGPVFREHLPARQS